MKVRFIATYHTDDEELYKGLRRVNILSGVEGSEDLHKSYYGQYLKLARKIVDTDNFVVPITMDNEQRVYLLELDYVYDNIDYKVRINEEDYEDGVVELFI